MIFVFFFFLSLVLRHFRIGYLRVLLFARSMRTEESAHRRRLCAAF